MNAEQRDTLLIEMHGNTRAIRQRLDDHIENPVIHGVPPCSAHKSLVTKLWAVAFAAGAGLIGAVWHQIK